MSETDSARIVELCEAEEVPDGDGLTVRAADRDFAVFRAEGEFWAIDNMCTHEGGPLGEGTLLGTTITCPWHYAAFDITTGESLDPIAPCGVGTYDVFVEDGVVYAELES